MAFQIRRGTDAERLTITPADGEPVYTTDTKKFFIGDGATVGGISQEPKYQKTLTQPNDLVLLLGNARWYPSNNINIVSVSASVGTAPTGSSIIVVIKKNGVAAYTLTILAAANLSDILTSVTGILTTDYVTVDVTQIGATTPGTDLTVTIEYENT